MIFKPNCLIFCLTQNLKDNIALTVLENVDGFLVAETLQADGVYIEDLISSLEASLFSCSSLFKNGLHKDWHISVGWAKTSNDRESKSVLSSDDKCKKLGWLRDCVGIELLRSLWGIGSVSMFDRWFYLVRVIVLGVPVVTTFGGKAWSPFPRLPTWQ